MKQLPTAKEYIHQFQNKFKAENYRDGVVKGLMIEFAKLHVKAALEAAAGNASVKYVHNPKMSDYNHETAVVDKESILNSYPDENIM